MPRPCDDEDERHWVALERERRVRGNRAPRVGREGGEHGLGTTAPRAGPSRHKMKWESDEGDADGSGMGMWEGEEGGGGRRRRKAAMGVGALPGGAKERLPLELHEAATETARVDQAGT